MYTAFSVGEEHLKVCVCARMDDKNTDLAVGYICVF